MDIKKKLQKTIDQGVTVSKKYFDFAKEKAKDFGETSVAKLELHQLEEKVKKLKIELGEAVYTLFSEGDRQSISVKTPEIKTIMESINTTVKEIVLKHEELEKEDEENKGETPE